MESDIHRLRRARSRTLKESSTLKAKLRGGDLAWGQGEMHTLRIKNILCRMPWSPQQARAGGSDRWFLWARWQVGRLEAGRSSFSSKRSLNYSGVTGQVSTFPGPAPRVSPSLLSARGVWLSWTQKTSSRAQFLLIAWRIANWRGLPEEHEGSSQANSGNRFVFRDSLLQISCKIISS